MKSHENIFNYFALKMSVDKTLNEQFLDVELPNEVRDYLNRLNSLNESQQKELDSIRQKNERLERKLKNIQAYNEELREQVISSLYTTRSS
jgi:hypothetical protein